MIKNIGNYSQCENQYVDPGILLGGACNVNVHLHQLLIDGAYELNADKIPKDFHKTAPPTVPELEGLVKTIAHRVAKYLEKNGIIVKDDDFIQAFTDYD
ncbi:MAG: transposase [Bdellovibrionales bacterium]|nr:transposase [Bdellovibrionales bacterium]